MSPAAQRGLRLTGAVALTLTIYWASSRAAPTIHLGILYLVPLLLITWSDGVGWGLGLAAFTAALRLSVEAVQNPQETPGLAPVWNVAAYVLVVAVALLSLRHLRRVQDQLRDLATHDPLTSVLNARAFSQALRRELERNRRYGRPMALLYLDLDDFKAVNDAHGHETGDAVLRLVADAIQHAVRQADIVGRLGGDEFAVLMPETDGALANAAASRLAGDIRTVFHGTPPVTASIGVLACGGTEAGSEELLRRADQAMYQAKRAGKNRVIEVALEPRGPP